MASRSSRVRVTAAVAAALVLATSAAAAEEGGEVDEQTEAARRHFESGVALIEEGNLEGALAEFRASHLLRPHPAVLYNIGVVERRLHRYADAVETFGQYLDEAEAAEEPPGRLEEVRRIVSELEAVLATVSVEVSEPEANVYVEGEFIGTTPLEAPIRLEAGTHSIEVRLEGFRTHVETIEVHGQERRELVVELRPIEGGPWYHQWWVWTTVGLVLAGAAVAIALPLSLAPQEADFGPIRIVSGDGP